VGKLKDLKLPSEEVPTPGGSLTVRGLSLVDITSLVRGRFTEMAALFEKYAPMIGDGSDMNEGTLEAIGSGLVDSAPEIVGHIIALGSGGGDDEDIQLAMKLPFPVQIAALEKVAMLTFDAGGGPKKVLETVVRVLRQVADLMRDARLSKTGSQEIAGKSASS